MKLFSLLKKQWIYFKDDKRKIFIISIITLIGSIIGIFYGFVNGKAIEYITEYNIKLTIIYLGVYLLITIVNQQVLGRTRRVLTINTQNNYIKKISYAIYQKVMLLPAKAFEEKKSGEFINRITSDTETISDLLKNILNNLIEIFGTSLVIFYVFYNSWIIGIFITIYILIIFIISKKYTPVIKKQNEEIKKVNDSYIASINQGVLGIRDIKATGIKDNYSKNIFTTITDLFKKRKDTEKFELNYTLIIWFLDILFEVFILIACGYLYYKHQITLTFLISMTWYLYRFMWIVENFVSISNMYQKLIVSIERINEILDNKLYPDEAFGTVNKNNILGEIEFKNVNFGYEENNIMLNGFNLKIESNKKIAIVGRSGSGKTTLFNLLLRLFNQKSGEILIDDIKIEDYAEESLRSNLSVIRQDPFLFNKTIKENFELINPEVTLDKIKNVCKKAYIHEYIESLPEKYDTLIGEGGVNLSGGQKQRLAIARALIKNSKIILFDEATSALDNESQEYIKKTIDDLSKNHTIVIIAHRLSTIQDADKIYLMDKGKIVASGKHDELMGSNKMYQKLYNPETIELNI